MYKVLTSKVNNDILDSVLLNSESDYLSYSKDNNYVSEDGFKKVMFGKPDSYPVILVSHFRASFNRFCDHAVFGEYIYPSSFEFDKLMDIREEIERLKKLVDDPILSDNDLIIGERNAYYRILKLIDNN